MRVRAVILASSLMVAACGDSSTKGTPGTALDGCRAYAQALISSVSSCQGEAPFAAYLTQAQIDYSCNQIQAHVTAGKVVYHADKIADCEAAIQSAGCDVLRSPAVLASCIAAFQGTVAVGGSCTSTLDCADGNECSIQSNMCPGTCVALAAAGASCTGDSDCKQGLYCHGGMCSSTLAGSGQACTASDQCQPGLYCNGNGCTAELGAGAACSSSEACQTGKYTCASGMCASPMPVGGTCQNSNDCQSGVCASGACASLTFANVGQPCGFLGSNMVAACTTGFCNIPMGSMQGTCMAMVAVGGACTGNTFGECVYGANCVNKVCVTSSCQ